MPRRVPALLGAVLVLSVSALSAAAAPAAGELLPPPTAFGRDWTLVGASRVDPAADPFASTASAMYGGPAGARVFVRVLVAAPGQAGPARAAAGQAFAGLRSLVREGVAPADRPKPAGCAEAQRAEGKDAAFPDFPAGVTACAAGPDLAVEVGVFGTVAGLSGTKASDAVIETVLRVRTAAVASPAATP